MRAVGVVVIHELAEYRNQLAPTEDEHAVEALAPKGAYDPLAFRVRIWRPHGRADDLDPFGGEHAVEAGGEP